MSWHRQQNLHHGMGILEEWCVFVCNMQPPSHIPFARIDFSRSQMRLHDLIPVGKYRCFVGRGLCNRQCPVHHISVCFLRTELPVDEVESISWSVLSTKLYHQPYVWQVFIEAAIVYWYHITNHVLWKWGWRWGCTPSVKVIGRLPPGTRWV